MSNFSTISAAAFVCALALAMAHSVGAIFGPFNPGPYNPDDFVTAHNRARFWAGVPGVVGRDAQLEKQAQEEAAQCNFFGAGPTPPTENHLWLRGSGVYHAADAVALWVGEKAYYDSAKMACTAPPGQTCDHYIRVVSPRTQNIGCASQICRTLFTREPVYYFICKYS